MRLCSRCRRHIREEVCPFCGAPAREQASPALHRVGRLFFAVGAGAAVSGYACSAYGLPPTPSGPYVAVDTGTDGDAADPDAPLFDVK